ncbi:MAG TPA: hypothetical protein VF310_09745 [Vicinamibacteria bacterium]
MYMEIYHGGVLAAELDDGRAPVYHGAAGRWVQAALGLPHPARPVWTGESAPGAWPAWPAWWAADRLGVALAVHGFTVRASDRPG